MNKNNFCLLLIGYCLFLVSLMIYSYTQVDLNLTLSSWFPYQAIQKPLLQLGYFNRFLSGGIFLVLLVSFFIFYFLFIWLVKNKKIDEKQICFLIILQLIILLFSYPAFSHDIFNYIFDAKTVIFYERSPYQVKPIDYSTDPMLRFMHWTHRPSIYPPGWIGLTLIPYWLSFGKFIFQLYFFKLMMALFWLGSVYLIAKILNRINPQNKLLGIVYYAFNPLIVIESLISAHSDVVMFFFVLLAFWLLMKKEKRLTKTILALVSFVISIEMKYISGILAPVILLILYKKFRVKKVDWQSVFKISLLTMCGGIFYVIYRIGFQPWYLLWVIPFVALLTENRWAFWLTISFCLGSLLRYLPYLLTGNWGRLFKLTSPWLTVMPLLICFCLLLQRSLRCSKNFGKRKN